MRMRLSGRILIMLAVCGLCFELGWQTKPERTVMQVSALQGDALERFNTQRDQLRAMERAQLEEILHSEGADAELCGMARRRLMEINASAAQEQTIEGVLELRGYGSCAVTVQGDAVNVLVEKEIITRQDSSLIMELVCRETGALGGNVKIIPVNSLK